MKSSWWFLAYWAGIMLVVMATVAFVDGRRTLWIGIQAAIYGALFVLGLHKSGVIREFLRRRLGSR